MKIGFWKWYWGVLKRIPKTYTVGIILTVGGVLLTVASIIFPIFGVNPTLLLGIPIGVTASAYGIYLIEKQSK